MLNKSKLIIIIGFFFTCGIFDSSESIQLKKLYVCLQAQDQVAVYNTPNLELLKLIDIKFASSSNTPHYVVLDEINHYWFVTGMDGGYIAQFNLLTDEFIDTIAVGDVPALMTIDPVNKILFCSRMNMSDMPGNGDDMMSGMDDDMSNMSMMSDNVITGVSYSDTEMTKIYEFNQSHGLMSPSLHAISYDYNKENIVTASISDDWLYKISLEGQIISNTLDPKPDEIETIMGNPNLLQPLQITVLNDSLVAISCSGFPDGINGQIQIWNISSSPMSKVTEFEFNDKAIPWHLIKSPISNEIFVVLGGFNGEGGVVCLTYTENTISSKWEYYNSEFSALHGITVDEIAENIYVTSRGDHLLYQFDAKTGALIDSVPLGASGQIVIPGGLSVMQDICIGCN